MESVEMYQSLISCRGKDPVDGAMDIGTGGVSRRADREPHITLASYDTWREANGIHGINPRKWSYWKFTPPERRL